MSAVQSTAAPPFTPQRSRSAPNQSGFQLADGTVSDTSLRSLPPLLPFRVAVAAAGPPVAASQAGLLSPRRRSERYEAAMADLAALVEGLELEQELLIDRVFNVDSHGKYHMPFLQLPALSQSPREPYWTPMEEVFLRLITGRTVCLARADFVYQLPHFLRLQGGLPLTTEFLRRTFAHDLDRYRREVHAGHTLFPHPGIEALFIACDECWDRPDVLKFLLDDSLTTDPTGESERVALTQYDYRTVLQWKKAATMSGVPAVYSSEAAPFTAGRLPQPPPGISEPVYPLHLLLLFAGADSTRKIHTPSVQTLLDAWPGAAGAVMWDHHTKRLCRPILPVLLRSAEEAPNNRDEHGVDDGDGKEQGSVEEDAQSKLNAVITAMLKASPACEYNPEDAIDAAAVEPLSVPIYSPGQPSELVRAASSGYHTSLSRAVPIPPMECFFLQALKVDTPISAPMLRRVLRLQQQVNPLIRWTRSRDQQGRCAVHIAYSRPEVDDAVRELLLEEDPVIACTVEGSGLNIAHLACRCGLEASAISHLASKQQDLFTALSPQDLDPLAYALVGPQAVDVSVVIAVLTNTHQDAILHYRHPASGRNHLHLLLQYQLQRLMSPRTAPPSHQWTVEVKDADDDALHIWPLFASPVTSRSVSLISDSDALPEAEVDVAGDLSGNAEPSQSGAVRSGNRSSASSASGWPVSLPACVHRLHDNAMELILPSRVEWGNHAIRFRCDQCGRGCLGPRYRHAPSDWDLCSGCSEVFLGQARRVLADCRFVECTTKPDPRKDMDQLQLAADVLVKARPTLLQECNVDGFSPFHILAASPLSSNALLLCMRNAWLNASGQDASNSNAQADEQRKKALAKLLSGTANTAQGIKLDCLQLAASHSFDAELVAQLHSDMGVLSSIRVTRTAQGILRHPLLLSLQRHTPSARECTKRLTVVVEKLIELDRLDHKEVIETSTAAALSFCQLLQLIPTTPLHVALSHDYNADLVRLLCNSFPEELLLVRDSRGVYCVQLIAIQHERQYVPQKQREEAMSIIIRYQVVPLLHLFDLIPLGDDFHSRHGLNSSYAFGVFHWAVFFREMLLIQYLLCDLWLPISARQSAGLPQMPFDGLDRHPLTIAASVRYMNVEVLEMLYSAIPVQARERTACRAMLAAASVSSIEFLFKKQPAAILGLRIDEPAVSWLFEASPMPILSVLKRVGNALRYRADVRDDIRNRLGMAKQQEIVNWILNYHHLYYSRPNVWSSLFFDVVRDVFPFYLDQVVAWDPGNSGMRAICSGGDPRAQQLLPQFPLTEPAPVPLPPNKTNWVSVALRAREVETASDLLYAYIRAGEQKTFEMLTKADNDGMLPTHYADSRLPQTRAAKQLASRIRQRTEPGQKLFSVPMTVVYQLDMLPAALDAFDFIVSQTQRLPTRSVTGERLLLAGVRRSNDDLTANTEVVFKFFKHCQNFTREKDWYVHLHALGCSAPSRLLAWSDKAYKRFALLEPRDPTTWQWCLVLERSGERLQVNSERKALRDWLPTARAIVRTLEALRVNGIVHGNVEPGNILLINSMPSFQSPAAIATAALSTESGAKTCRLCDLQTCCSPMKPSTDAFQNCLLALPDAKDAIHWPPEWLDWKSLVRTDTFVPDMSFDIWSLGILWFRVRMGFNLFQLADKDPQAQHRLRSVAQADIDRIIDLPSERQLSMSEKQLLKLMLAISPEERAQADVILSCMSDLDVPDMGSVFASVERIPLRGPMSLPSSGRSRRDGAVSDSNSARNLTLVIGNSTGTIAVSTGSGSVTAPASSAFMSIGSVSTVIKQTFEYTTVGGKKVVPASQYSLKTSKHWDARRGCPVEKNSSYYRPNEKDNLEAQVHEEVSRVPSSVLRDGWKYSEAVAMIYVLGWTLDGAEDPNGPGFSGTCFVVSCGPHVVLMTCWHVLQHSGFLRRASVWFNHLGGEPLDSNLNPRRPACKLSQDVLFCSESLDCCLVILAPESKAQMLLACRDRERGPLPVSLPLDPKDSNIPDQEQLLILHHPVGRPQEFCSYGRQITVQASAYQHLWYRSRVHYTNDTDGGSSGAPVFNHQWQLLALHRAFQDDDVQPANEGVRADYIVAWLREIKRTKKYNKVELNSLQEDVLDQLLTASRK